MGVLECLYIKPEIVLKIRKKNVLAIFHILYLCSQIFCIYAHKYFVFSTGGGGRLRKNKINNKFR